MNLIRNLLKSAIILGMFVLLLSIFPNCSSSDSDDGDGGTADSDDTAAGGTVATSTIGGFGSIGIGVNS